MLLNLHSHLEGRVRPRTALELAQRLGLPDAERDWEEALQLDGPSDLTVYLEKVAASYPFFSDRDALTRTAREAVEDAAADGQDYLELRFGPATHVRDGFGLDEVVAAVCEGVAQGSAVSGMAAGAVVAALRHHDAELNEAVAASAARFAGRGVVGFDLAGDELRYPGLEPYTGCFAIARSAGLGLSCHAAEAAPGSAASRAVELFGVSRIGHGAHIVEDQDAIDHISQHGIVVEICPSSNRYTGAIADVGAHPAPRFRDAGIRLVLGDDNPRQTMSPLSAEAGIVADVLGFGTDGLAEIARRSILAGFMEDGTRARLLERLGRVHPS